ncbi:MAG: chorismate mutase [Actinomycetota bacterium]|nr:chorismate mutase [Actinomycetota bacterium]
MALRAVRGAIQLDVDEREHLVSSVTELVKAVLDQNGLAPDDLVSVLFTATPDIHSEFPALAARSTGLGAVPLLCAQELDIDGAMPRVVRLLVHAETDLPREEIRHVYLRGAAALRRDLAQ